MRLPAVTFLLAAMLIAAGCSDPQSVQGVWDCSTNHPGGLVSHDIFNFTDKGTMTLDSGGMMMRGSYKQDGTALTMQLLDVPVPDPSGKLSTQPQTLTATIQKKGAKEMEMDVSTGINHHLSKCRRN